MADPELAERLARARLAAAELQAATDALNESLSAAEHALAVLGLGVSASVMLEEDRETGATTELCFERRSAGWKLVIVDQFSPYDEPSEKHVLQSSRGIRQRAAAALPDLLDSLIHELAVETDHVREATETAGTFAGELASAHRGPRFVIRTRPPTPESGS